MNIEETTDNLKAEFREWYTTDKGYPQEAFTEFLILHIHELEMSKNSNIKADYMV